MTNAPKTRKTIMERLFGWVGRGKARKEQHKKLMEAIHVAEQTMEVAERACRTSEIHVLVPDDVEEGEGHDA